MQKNLHVSILLDIYGAVLTEKQYKIMDCYYNDDLSLSEIAENEGITRQGVRDAVKRSEALLFEMENKLAILEKKEEMKLAIEEIRKATIEISEFNLRYGSSREINERAKAIYELAGELA